MYLCLLDTSWHICLDFSKFCRVSETLFFSHCWCKVSSSFPGMLGISCVGYCSFPGPLACIWAPTPSYAFPWTDTLPLFSRWNWRMRAGAAGWCCCVPGWSPSSVPSRRCVCESIPLHYHWTNFWILFCPAVFGHPKIIPVGQFFQPWIKSINQA